MSSSPAMESRGGGASRGGRGRRREVIRDPRRFDDEIMLSSPAMESRGRGSMNLSRGVRRPQEELKSR